MVFATGENITHSGVLTVNGVQTLGAGGLTEGGTGSLVIDANVVSTAGANVFNSPAAAGDEPGNYGDNDDFQRHADG